MLEASGSLDASRRRFLLRSERAPGQVLANRILADTKSAAAIADPAKSQPAACDQVVDHD